MSNRQLAIGSKRSVLSPERIASVQTCALQVENFLRGVSQASNILMLTSVGTSLVVSYLNGRMLA